MDGVTEQRVSSVSAEEEDTLEGDKTGNTRYLISKIVTHVSKSSANVTTKSILAFEIYKLALYFTRFGYFRNLG